MAHGLAFASGRLRSRGSAPVACGSLRQRADQTRQFETYFCCFELAKVRKRRRPIVAPGDAGRSAPSPFDAEAMSFPKRSRDLGRSGPGAGPTGRQSKLDQKVNAFFTVLFKNASTSQRRRLAVDDDADGGSVAIDASPICSPCFANVSPEAVRANERYGKE